jgi:hypothetical protein
VKTTTEPVTIRFALDTLCDEECGFEDAESTHVITVFLFTSRRLFPSSSSSAEEKDVLPCRL